MATYISTADKSVTKPKRASRDSARVGTVGVLAVAPWSWPSLKCHGAELGHHVRAARGRCGHARARLPRCSACPRCSCARICTSRGAEYHCGGSPRWFACWRHSLVCAECRAVQASAWHARDGTRTHRAGSRGRASVAAMARQPCCSVLGEPVGRPGGEPDGGRDQHDGLARWWAGVATDRPP